jgi:antitoxin component YwqK of YwqJK toxin-antitoxin module
MNDDMQLRVRDELLDYDEELNYTYEGKPFTGVGYDEVPGFGISEISYSGGFQEGSARDWYPSGKLKSETFYKANMRHGSNREFREDGNVVLEEQYEYGVLVRSVRRGDGGKVVADFEISEGSPGWDELRSRRQRFG